MTSTSYVDISGLIGVQKSYLANLNENTDNSTAVISNLTAIQTNLNNASTALGNNSSAYVLSGQNAVYDIVTREKSRLDAKKAAIETAESNQTRMITLNTNSKKRYVSYTNIIIAVVLALLAFIGATALNATGFIPLYIYILSVIVIFTATLYYCGSSGLDIMFRDKIYFDEISTDSPFLKSPQQIAYDISMNKTYGSGHAKYMNNLTLGGMGCFDEQCCSGNTVWDATTKVCMPAAGFATLATAGVSKYAGAIPYTTSEFSEYAKL